MARLAVMRGLAGLLLCLAAWGAGPARAADEYLEDVRTARGVTIGAPRATLRECLRVLSTAAGVTLSAAPALADEPLVAYVPKRALRETMAALAELYDGVWTVQPPAGAERAYRLDPDPAKAKARDSARELLLKRYVKALNEQAAATMREVKSGILQREGRSQSQTMGMLIWWHMTPADREKALRGASVTFTIPEVSGKPIHELVTAISGKELKKLTGPLWATVDLDDWADQGLPFLRARATAMRENSVSGAIAPIELTKLHSPARMPPPGSPAEGPALPADIGQGGQLSGTRDEIIVKLGLASGLPILSRHRAYGGSLSGIAVGGRKVGEVMAQLGVQLDAQATATARGFQLLRSLTDLMDLSGLPAAAPVQSYLRKQPKPGETVSFAALADLAALTPLQLSVLERSNIASEEASFVREAYALLRFYQGLSPAQQQALFSKEGLDVSELTHEQWHALLDQRDKRGDFNILNSVQEIKGLRFRFLERRDRKEGSFRAEALRAGQLVAEADLDLPVVEAEVRPIAAR